MTDYTLDSKSADYKQNLREIIDSSTDITPKILVGSTAYHQLGNISRDWGTAIPYEQDRPEYFCAQKETEHYYIGSWIEGFGFFNVVYPKNTTRELTQQELKYYNTLRFGIR